MVFGTFPLVLGSDVDEAGVGVGFARILVILFLLVGSLFSFQNGGDGWLREIAAVCVFWLSGVRLCRWGALGQFLFWLGSSFFCVGSWSDWGGMC